jgi:tripartite-type tricarboxylate transporter receptor subunit TctC
MSRLIVLIVVIAVLIGALFFLSTLPKQQPTHTIEVVVPQGAAAGGNAH